MTSKCHIFLVIRFSSPPFSSYQALGLNLGNAATNVAVELARRVENALSASVLGHIITILVLLQLVELIAALGDILGLSAASRRRGSYDKYQIVFLNHKINVS